MDNQTILYITPNFSPLNSSASITNVYYCKELSRLGYKVIVLASEIPKDHINYQESFLCSDSNIIVRRTDIGLYKKYYARKIEASTRKHAAGDAYISKLLKKLVKDIMFTPDVFIYWARNSMQIAKNIIEEFSPTIIITASEPNSVHILGSNLKNEYPHLRWIAYFGDPWSLEPSLNKIHKLIQLRIEKKVLPLIDKFVFTTDATRDLYCKEFNIPIQKTSVFSRGYDPEIYKIKNTVKLDPAKINFVYSGAIGRQRDIMPFLNALDDIKAYLQEKVVFYFVGSYPAEIKEKFEKYAFIKLPGFVTLNESIMFQQEADFLILLDNRDGIQLPAKAFEYMGTNKPIITFLTNDNTPLGKLMRQVKRGPIGYNTRESITKILFEAIKLDENNEIINEWKTANKEFEIGNIVKNFALANFA